ARSAVKTEDFRRKEHVVERTAPLHQRGDLKTKPILRCGPETGLPSTATAPLVGAVSPAMTRISVVLPQPLGPSTETNSPGSTRKFSRSSAGILVSAVT